VSTVHDYNLLNMTGDIQVFSFWVEDVPYALRIDHVLTISQDLTRLRKVHSAVQGLVGLIDYQGTVVPVMDFAQLLGQRNQSEIKTELIKLLDEREKDHLAWVDALQQALINGTEFTKERDPHKCAFGRWYDSFQPKDEALAAVFKSFDAPHKRIHALADELLGLALKEGKERALQVLQIERDTTLKALQRAFSFAREALRISQHTVLLYVTSDGRTPRLALRLDDISDILTFDERDCVPLDSIDLPKRAIPNELITAYLRGKAGDCFLLEPASLVQLAEQAQLKVA